MRARDAYRLIVTRGGLAPALLAHPTRDGGLICEHLRDGCRPGFYRVTPAGAIEPDQVLDRRTLSFTPALLPAGLR